MTGEKTRLMTTEEVAAYLQMSEEFVSREAREGRIPSVRMGIKWRFRRESLEQYVKSLESGLGADIYSSVHASQQQLSKAS